MSVVENIVLQNFYLISFYRFDSPIVLDDLIRRMDSELIEIIGEKKYPILVVLSQSDRIEEVPQIISNSYKWKNICLQHFIKKTNMEYEYKKEI